jgi:hypothetical protein
MTTKVFPNAKPLFETSQQQLVANGALIEWFAEVHGAWDTCMPTTT